jgi:broad specificity phosphatase PhoE
MKHGMIVGVTLLFMIGAPPLPAAAQQVIFLMRHSEPMRPAAQTDPDPPLAEAGHRRARILADRLKEVGISAIYVTDTQRTRQTAEPTAKALGLEPRVVGRQEIESLVASVRSEHPQDRVLIVNHALNVPGLLKAFGHPDGIRVALDDFEPLFVIVPRPPGPPLVIFLRL